VPRRWSGGDKAERPKEFAWYASRTLRCCGNKIDAAHAKRAAQRAGEKGAKESSNRCSERALPRARCPADQQHLTSGNANFFATQI
jgi:hypothetical protein